MKKNTALSAVASEVSDDVLVLDEAGLEAAKNSLSDGLWYFEFIFKAHTQQHILDLLNYMKQKNS